MHLIEEKSVSRIQRSVPEVLAVGGGKGGVGKTCLAANLAVEVARRGWRVIIVDADLICSNVETVLGTRSEKKLDDFFYQRGGKDLESIVCETHYDNLKIIPGTTGLLEVANPKYQQKIALIRELKTLEADLIVVDLDAGAHLNTLDFFLMTETNGVLVITPEKTSIDNAFKFLRASLFRRVERFYQSPEVALLLKRIESFREFVECVGTSNLFAEGSRETVCRELAAVAGSMKPKIVVNRARNAYEAQIAANILSKHSRQYLMIEPENLGYMVFDNRVPETINSGTPLVVSYPKLKVSQCIGDVASRLGYF